MADISGWILLNYQEILGTITSLLYLYFSVIQNKWLWPLGFVSSAIYAYVFFQSGIYADMGLQLYYVVISVYGWFLWVNMQNDNKEHGQIQSVIKTRYLILWLSLVTFGIFIFLSQILLHFTNSTIPYFDAFVTALSITATWMLAKKYIEQWLVWIFVDLISTGLYFYKGLYITILLYFIYTIFAVVGYFMWLKTYKKNKIEFLHDNSLAF
jgi:nicotinamide mononucleotide transporter